MNRRHVLFATLALAMSLTACFSSHERPPGSAERPPIVVPTSEPATLAFGMDGSLLCAIDAAGDLRCAGSFSGVVGTRLHAVDHPGEVLLDHAVDVAVTEDHVCAVREEGTVHCWGFNTYGQLSLPPEPAEAGEHFHSEPVQVVGIEDAVSVAVDGLRSCALRSSGDVLCWGIRRGASEDVPPERPEPIAGLSDVVELESGCARERSGRVVCFGSDSYSVLGERPEDGVGVIEGLPANIIDVATESYGALALDSEGGIWNWGMFLPHMTHPGAESFGSRARPALIATIPGALQLIAGRRRGGFVCALLEDGSLTCAGENGTAILGRGYAEMGPLQYDTIPAFEEASLLPPLREVATGQMRSCGITMEGGELVCWGADPDGLLLGGGTTRAADSARTALASVRDVGVGAGFGCALGEDRQVRCWGKGIGGRLGSGDARSQSSPAPVLGMDEVDALSVGAVATCAVRRGQVWCWGSSDRGIVPTRSDSPIAITLPGPATAVSTGTSHACAVVTTAAGLRAACWGDGTSGELGDSTFPERGAPRIIEALGDVEVVAAVDDATCTVSEGQVLCIGERRRFAVGEGTDAVTLTDELIRERGFEHVFVALEPVRVRGTLGARHVQAMGDLACAWVDEATVCWGPGIGAPRTFDSNELVRVEHSLCSASEHTCVGLGAEDTPVELPPGAALTYASTSQLACVLRVSGDVACWGEGSYGELGDGLAYALTPVTVDLSSLASM